MAIPSFFKQNKPRGFNYVPRYYDPAKEEMEQRRRTWDAHKRTGETDPEQQDSGQAAQSPEQGSGKRLTGPYRSTIMRGDMKNYFHRRTERVERHTMIRIAVIIIVMVLAVYLYLRF